jgi:RNA polymerase primary sigma factor
MKATTRSTKKTSSEFNCNILDTYFRDINRYPILSAAEEEETAKKAAAGDKAARAKLLNANLRFVVHVAKRYQSSGVPLADLIGEGNVGLIHAVEHFNPDAGSHFVSYAIWWIRQSIARAIREKYQTIRCPAGTSLPEPVSLDMPANPEAGDSPLSDYLVDDKTPSPEEVALNDSLRGQIDKALKALDSREAAIIRRRYGLDTGAPGTLNEVGYEFSITKERVRQIESRALRRLRARKRIRQLQSYVA